MKYLKIPLVVLLTVMLTGLVGLVPVSAQSTALERGYRTGYSDGYTAGFKDTADRASRNFQDKEDYQKADRSYNDVWGPIEDYRDGYRQGFETGYSAGFEQQQFNSTLPVGLQRRGNGGATVSMADDANVAVPDNTNVAVNTSSLGIPRNTVLALELQNSLSTDATQRGDRFQARVVEPAEYAGWIVEGRVSQVKKPGKVKGVAELQLAFDQIRSPDNRVASLHAELIEIVPMGPDGTAEIDSEGGVKGRDSSKDDAAKVGGAAGIGAIIGVIAGGGTGAAIGAIIGGGAGTARVMTQRGKDIRLERGQHLKIRTATDTSSL